MASTLVLIFFAMLGFLSPAHRGGLLTTMLLLFVFMGIFGGFYSARMYKLFKGESWKSNTLVTALLFPGVCFAMFFLLNFFLVAERSSGAVPFTTLLTILVLWFGISLPLTFLGGILGHRAPEMESPCKVNRIPHPVKETKWYLSTWFVMVVGGILPFGAIFIEIMFIMRSIWTTSTFYYMFGFLFLVLIILMITSAEISMVIIYFQLCAEDYRWWWRAYLISGASGCYLYVHSVFYLFSYLEMTRFSSIMLYLGYMLLVSYTLFIFTGTIGFASSYWFVKKIYSLIKVD